MSKLYNYYKLCKIEEPNKIIIIKCGTFFVILDNDAISINKLLGLKLTHLNENIVKCGFPIISLNKYTAMLDANNIEYYITSLDSSQNYPTQIEKVIINEIINLDINEISPIIAINLLTKYKKMLKNNINPLK